MRRYTRRAADSLTAGRVRTPGSARVGAGRRGACRCLVTRRQSPRGLNTVCTSVVRELDPMLARTNYQLIFHERGPGLRAPTTEYRLAKPVEKLVIQLSAVAERTRFIFLFFFFQAVSRFFRSFFVFSYFDRRDDQAESVREIRQRRII